MRASDLIPWRDFIIETSWSPEVAEIELRKRIDMLGSGGGPFKGRSVGQGQYKFRKVISYRNSFLPVITASVEPGHRGGARIRVSMRLNALVALFIAFWMTGATLGAVFIGTASLAHGQPGGLVAFALPIFGAGLTTIPFAVEARAAERLLREVCASAPALLTPDSGEAYR